MPNFTNPLKGLSRNQKIIAVGGAAAIGGYFVIHHHSTTGSWNPWSKGTGTSSANNPTAIDPVTGLAYSQDNQIDPITNLPYLAEAQQYGSVQAAESAVSQFGTSTASGTGVAPTGGTSATPPNTLVGSSVYTSNAAWAQAATAGLADIGYPETDVATALGDYLTSTPVTETQAGYIRAALSEYSDPPNGTFQIILIPVTKPKAGMATVPDVVTLDLEQAQRDITDANLKSTYSGPVFKAGNGTRIVTAEVPKAQTQLTQGSTVHLTYEVKGAKKQQPVPVDHGPVIP